MIANCVAVAAGMLLHVFPATAVTLSWRHTVERTLWEEDYAVRGDALVLTGARVHASGAGMEAGPGARWEGGAWHYVPRLPAMAEVVMANSGFAGGYTLCLAGADCAPLARYVPSGNTARLVVRRCPEGMRDGK